jgi:hypothetical protein
LNRRSADPPTRGHADGGGPPRPCRAGGPPPIAPFAFLRGACVPRFSPGRSPAGRHGAA